MESNKTSYITEKKIYDDFESMLNKKKKNSLVSTLKIILITFFLISSSLILFFAPLTIFSSKLFFNQNIEYFLEFSNLTTERINYLALFRIFLLLGIYLYTINKNFSNIFTHKESTKKYIPWFIVYLLFSFVSLILLFTFFKQGTMDYYALAWIAFPLLLIDIAYSIYTYKLKRKTNPLVYKNSKATLISIISRIILVSSFLLILSIWVFSIKGDKNDFLNNNIVHRFFVDMFSQKDSLNLFYIILFTALVAVTIFGINFERVMLIASKQYKTNEAKEKILLFIALSFTSLIWFIRALFYKSSSEVIKADEPSKNYLYLIGLVFISIFFVLYLLFNFLKKLKINGVLLNTILTSFVLTLIWITTTIVSLKNNEILVTNVTLLVSTLFSGVILIIYKLKTTNESLYTSIFLKASITFMITTLVVNGLNALLLSNNNQSFYNISTLLSLDQIFVIATLSILITFNISTVINLIITLNTLTKKSKITKGSNK
ncbi:MSC_0624 family F1-like ATPase-associated membrane protein [Metamycoplasma gateae]|uniref:Beta-carotene 15,15'-monooxygenase n=1 Tax=Metamycoplasma gateae TaxID=35769 RepID=A0ABZ2AJD6_9BACT|nr:hypothetical protein V2E26_01340 [Metamycoplasma gateae]